jgi:hypothetical protein
MTASAEGAASSAPTSEPSDGASFGAKSAFRSEGDRNAEGAPQEDGDGSESIAEGLAGF